MFDGVIVLDSESVGVLVALRLDEDVHDVRRTAEFFSPRNRLNPVGPDTYAAMSIAIHDGTET